jgi:hypothetical protein
MQRRQSGAHGRGSLMFSFAARQTASEGYLNRTITVKFKYDGEGQI